MSMRMVILISVLFLSSCQENHVNREVVISNLKENLDLYLDARENMEPLLLTEFLPPNVSSDSSKVIKYINSLLYSYKLLYKRGITTQNYNYKAPYTILFNESDIFNAITITPITYMVYTPEKKYTLHSHIYCLSNNYGKSWFFSEKEGLHSYYSEDIISKFQQFKIEETRLDSIKCNHFLKDPLGYEICIDRYVDSGKYGVSESEIGIGKLKLVEPPRLYNQKVYLIQEAVNEFVKLNNNYPFEINIDRSNISYIGSEIGRYFVYPIFEVKNSKYNRKIIGYFKEDYVYANNIYESTKDFSKEDDSFIIINY